MGTAVLGWHVSNGLDPLYWLGKEPVPKAGNQRDLDLVSVPCESLAQHAAIIAQSGSGKSYFLGRLIEEVLISTRMRCLIFDPNADFRRIHEVAPPDLWTNASYDLLRRLGKLPNEGSREEFRDKWDKVTKLVQTSSLEASKGDPYRVLRVPLTSLSVEFLTGDVDPGLQAELEHCHLIVQALSDILEINRKLQAKANNLLDYAEDLLDKSRILSEGQFDEEVRRLADINIDAQNEYPAIGRFPFLGYEISSEAKREIVEVIVAQAVKRIDASRKYISAPASRFYFARARQYEALGLLDPQIASKYDIDQDSSLPRVEVVDLPAMSDKASRLLAVNALLMKEWRRAQDAWNSALLMPEQDDIRVPTLIVVDEAHNLMPVQPAGREEAIIRDQFRMMVAEGRKYGIFLMVVSQRPDKLDPTILGECQNRAVLRLSSGAVLNLTREVLNLDDVPRQMLERTLSFGSGRVLLSGEWVENRPVILYSAARRTVEGGRNLRSAYWASPSNT